MHSQQATFRHTFCVGHDTSMLGVLKIVPLAVQ